MPSLDRAEQKKRNEHRDEVIEEAEHQQSGEHLLPVFAAEPDQDRRIEHTEACGRVAREAQQGGCNENGHQPKQPDVHFGRDQHIHGERGSRQIEKSDQDLRQDQRAGREPHKPLILSQASGMAPAPDQESHDPRKQRERQQPVDPRRQMIDHADGHRLVEQTDPERGHIAEPECESGQKADIRDAHGADAVSRIDPVTNDRRYQRNSSNPMRDWVAGETRKCRDAVGNVLAPHRVQRQPIIECDTAVRRRHQN
ncbi:MAG TPA: hypothetical protein VII39_03880 [Bradyrhizobium sp.]